MSSVETDLNKLLQATVELAEAQLAKTGEFYPFGVALTDAGDMIQLATDTEEDFPEIDEITDLIREGIQQNSGEEHFVAAALAVNVEVQIDEDGPMQDAVQIMLDHTTQDFALECVIPYTIDDKRHVELGEMLSGQAEERLFA